MNIDITDVPDIEIVSLRLSSSLELSKFKLLLRLKKRGADNKTAMKFGFILPFDCIETGLGSIPEAGLIPVIGET